MTNVAPTCKSCGLQMRFIIWPEEDWWDCECGQAYDRERDMWVY